MSETFDTEHPAFVCSSQNYYYFGLQGGGREFYCANSYGSAPQYTQVDDSECMPLCPGLENKPITKKNVDGIVGNDIQMTGVLCGGSWRNAVYTDDPVPARLHTVRRHLYVSVCVPVHICPFACQCSLLLRNACKYIGALTIHSMHHPC